MKRLTALILVLFISCSLLSCSKGKEEVVCYSFSGENEYFAITRGSIIPNYSSEGIIVGYSFDGGYLEIIQEEIFSEIISCSTICYTMMDGERTHVLIEGMKAVENRPININRKLGRIDTSPKIMNQNGLDTKQLLWFELKVTDINGKEEIYEMPLELTPIYD